MKIIQKLKTWYRGKNILPSSFELALNKDSVLPLLPRYNPPFLAKILNGIGNFWLKHWKWIIGTIISIIGIYLINKGLSISQPK